jgi:hypothetical protein
VVHYEDDARIFVQDLVQGRETSFRVDTDVVEGRGDPGRERDPDPEVQERVEGGYDLTRIAPDPGHRKGHRDAVLVGVSLGGPEQLRVVGEAVDQGPPPGQLEAG